MYYPMLRAQAQNELKKINRADLVIGLPSQQNTRSAMDVARMALAAVHQFYPQLRVVLINVDAGRSAETRRAISSLASENGHNSIVIASRYNGPLGHGSATAAMLDAALALDARAIVTLDTFSSGVSVDWIGGLAHLILENKADLVLPRYRQWLQPDGLLNDIIAYPLFRAVWGRSVRCPAAVDFAVSPRLATHLLDEDVWGTAAGAYGLTPWLATYAVVNGWRVAQSAIGEKCIGCDASGRAWTPEQRGVEAKFHDVLSALFRQVYRYQDYWQRQVDGVQSLPTLTQFASAAGSGPFAAADVSDLLDKLALGWMEYRKIWRQVLTPRNLSQLESLVALPAEQFYFPSDLWARIVYDFVTVFNHGDIDPQQVLWSLYPLYQGRLAAYWQEIAGLALVGREGTVAAQAVEFEELRKYFKMRWQSYQSRFYRPGIDDRPVI